ncbi:hypothetical protein ACIQ2D_11810 [Lysinibacillus sp. NPDC097287]|uniref:hypothetical protein n=1 Tax=Lysinibacillus sp. NPDC097287 TaxID=3364144 RepID=UPI0037F7C968
MSEIDEQEKDVLMRSLLNDFMKEQIAKLNDNSKKNNNSFAFLEKGTLNLLIGYLLSGEKNQITLKVNEEFEIKVVKELDEMIENNKKEFEEIISLLKNLS